MKRRDILIGIVVLALLTGVVYWRQKSQKLETPKVPETLSTEKALEDKFNIQIPEDVSKAELKDTSGGSASGIATRNFKDGTFTSSVIADLPAPESGQFYQAWLVKGDQGSSDYSAISLGTFRNAKGGYLLDYKSKTDLSDHNKVVVSLEKKLDKTPEKSVLEGSF